MNHELIDFAIIILFSLAAALGVGRLRQPPILGFILAGLLLGPSVLGLVEDREQIEVLAELGVLMLLFLIGVEIPTTRFHRVWKPALSVATLQALLSIAITSLISFLFHVPLATAIVFGFVITLSSTAVVVKMLTTMRITASPVGQIIVGILVAQDLMFIPMMLIVNMLSATDISIYDVARVLLAMALMAVILFILNRKGHIRLPLAHATSKNRELVVLRAAALCFGSAALSGIVGFSPAYGAFLMGIIVAHSDERKHVLNELMPIETLLMMMFFLSIGLLIDIDYIVRHWRTVALALFVVVMLKTLLNIFLLRVVGEPWHHALVAGFLLAQIGEFSFLISKAAQAGQLITDEQASLIITTAALSLAITPLWLTCGRYGMRLFLEADRLRNILLTSRKHRDP
ncbi:MAG: cation:proton antiporter [Alphaproteobacteria bacterium GM7ARS4]|nr:cation:proton antiporter [Alphaproteobacteria bacterium GM7ARS4]